MMTAQMAKATEVHGQQSLHPSTHFYYHVLRSQNSRGKLSGGCEQLRFKRLPQQPG